MILSPHNDADLIWYYNVADVDGRGRSGFGSILERQEARYRDSRGDIIPLPTHYNYITVKADTHTTSEPSYEPDHSTSMRAGRISRRMNRICSRHRDALAAYHGPLGLEWEKLFGRSRRAMCLIPQLPAGKKWLRPLYRKYQSISADLIVRLEVQDQDRNPNDIREKQLELLEHDAIRLRLEAERRYQHVAETDRLHLV